MDRYSYKEHRELGNVNWLREYESALQIAKLHNKPIVLLFQEVPGCAGCVNFGHDVLEHPLLVELIEDQFVPLAIFNNHPGKDAEILGKFNETAWNYPVVYVLDEGGNPIVPKLTNRYDPDGLFEKLCAALSVLGIDLPEYAKLLRDDLIVEYGLAKTVTFETPCFWSGETSLAGLKGVLTTLAGWIGGEEVVRVEFDPERVIVEQLERFASTEGFKRTNKSGFRVDKTPQYYVSKTDFAHIPLSPVQRTKINLAIPYRNQPERFLSPRQAAMLAWPNLARVFNSDTYKGNIRDTFPRLKDVAT